MWKALGSKKSCILTLGVEEISSYIISPHTFPPLKGCSKDWKRSFFDICTVTKMRHCWRVFYITTFYTNMVTIICKLMKYLWIWHRIQDLSCKSLTCLIRTWTASRLRSHFSKIICRQLSECFILWFFSLPLAKYFYNLLISILLERSLTFLP